jgi:hypothetical protein
METRPTAAPTHVLQPDPVSKDRSTSLIRGIRGRAGCGSQTHEARPLRASLRVDLDATPRTSRDDHATLGPWRSGGCSEIAGVPYMSGETGFGSAVGRAAWAM